MLGGMCDCGGRLQVSEHEVRSDAKASEWARQTIKGPVSVEQYVC